MARNHRADSPVIRLLSCIRMVEEALARQGRRLFCWVPVFFGLGVARYFVLKSEPSSLSVIRDSFCLLLLCGLFLWTESRFFLRYLGAFGLIIRAILAAGLSLGCGFVLAFLSAHHQPPFPALPYEAVQIKARLRLVEQHVLPCLPGHLSSSARYRKEEARCSGDGHDKVQNRLILQNVQFDSPWYQRDRPFQRRLIVTQKSGSTGKNIGKNTGKTTGTMQQFKDLAAMMGKEVRFRAMLRKPQPPAWPDGRDFQREAWFSDLAGYGTLLSSVTPAIDRGVVLQNAEVTARHGTKEGILSRKANWVVTGLEKARAGLDSMIQKVLSGQEAAIAATILCGETAGLSEETYQDFAASGLAHLLAVAGLHLGIVMGCGFVVIRGLLTRSEWMILHCPCRNIACGGAFLLGVAYIVFTGAHVPGVRAIGMAAVVTLALLLGRSILSLRVVALMALLMEAIRPFWVTNMSFQMSFAAVLCLFSGLEASAALFIRLDDILAPYGHRYGRIIQNILMKSSMIILVSALTGLATLPVSMGHFNVVQPWFLLANLLAVPLMGAWVMPCGLLACLLWPLGLGPVLLTMMGWGLKVIILIAHDVAAAPLAQVPVPSMPAWGLGFYFVGLAFLCLWRGRICLVGLLLVMVCLVSPWLIERPVLLVAPEYGLIAVKQKSRTSGEYALFTGPQRASSFQKLWGQDMNLPVKSLSDLCPPQQGFCRLSVAGRMVLLYLHPHIQAEDVVTLKAAPDFCKNISLIVSIARMRPICPSVPVIDRSAVWREGGWAVYAPASSSASFRLVSDRRMQGDRPWVPAIGQEGEQGIPLATEEKGPDIDIPQYQ